MGKSLSLKLKVLENILTLAYPLKVANLALKNFCSFNHLRSRIHQSFCQKELLLFLLSVEITGSRDRQIPEPSELE